MTTTLTVNQTKIDTLAAHLDRLDEQFDDDEKLTLLTVFALAAEAIDAREAREEQADVTGFAAGGVVVPVVGLGALGGLGGGLTEVFAKRHKAGGTQNEFLTIKMEGILI